MSCFAISWKHFRSQFAKQIFHKSETEKENYTKRVVLSPLEVKELDAVGKDEEEEENPTNMSNSNSTKEVIFIA